MASGGWQRSRPRILPPNWKSLSRSIRDRDKVCQIRGPHCTGGADECDHIGDPNDHRPENLRGACVTCHAERTKRQAAAGRASYHAQRKRPPMQHPGLM